MIPLLAVLAVMATLAGAVVLAAWWAGVLPEKEPRSSTGLWTDSVDNIDRAVLVRWGVVAMITVVATWYTGWPLLLVVVPVATLGLPKLLSEPAQTDIELLQSLDRWVRVVAATMSSGKSILDSLRLSVRQVPPPLRDPLVTLVRRLDDRWTPQQALRALADELSSPDADAVVASLILSVERGGNGSVTTLSALADSIQERLRALREVEAERSKPRVVVRQVTLVTTTVLVAAMVFSREFFTPFATPVGQTILAVLIGAYVASLAFLRRMTLPRRRERILSRERTPQEVP